MAAISPRRTPGGSPPSGEPGRCMSRSAQRRKGPNQWSSGGLTRRRIFRPCSSDSAGLSRTAAGRSSCGEATACGATFTAVASTRAPNMAAPAARSARRRPRTNPATAPIPTKNAPKTDVYTALSPSATLPTSKPRQPRSAWRPVASVNAAVAANGTRYGINPNAAVLWRSAKGVSANSTPADHATGHRDTQASKAPGGRRAAAHQHQRPGHCHDGGDSAGEQARDAKQDVVDTRVLRTQERVIDGGRAQFRHPPPGAVLEHELRLGERHDTASGEGQRSPGAPRRPPSASHVTSRIAAGSRPDEPRVTVLMRLAACARRRT